jgi:hypothetical protein
LATTAGAQAYGFYSGDDFSDLGYTSRTRSNLQVKTSPALAKI